jgi:class 3 adenylate cyclase
MDYDFISHSYRERQFDRILKNVKSISQRQLTAPGQTVPDQEDVVFGTGKRLQAAIMFVDITGFSLWPSETQIEQERVLIALNLLFSELVGISEDYGGTVEKNTGDGLMAYFEDDGGDPPESGCKRAVSCALTMVDVASKIINPFLVSRGFRPVEFRICIDYGFVTIARLGARRRFGALVAIGTTANVASKMLNSAKSWDIMVGEAVIRQLPLVWCQNWTQFASLITGWVYRQSGAPYPFYRYIGRWK